MRLSESMKDVVAILTEEGPLDDAAALVRLGPSRNVILKALERRGFARWYPYGGERGWWRITAAGRVINEEMFGEVVP